MLIEQHFIWPAEPEPEQKYDIRRALATPETRLIALACKVQDVFILYDEEGDIRGQKTPTLDELIPLAKKMAEMVIEQGATGATLNQANNLLKWIVLQQKARDIKAAAKWLADDVLEYPPLDKVDSDIPF